MMQYNGYSTMYTLRWYTKIISQYSKIDVGGFCFAEYKGSFLQTSTIACYLVQIRSYIIWYSMMDTLRWYTKIISWYSKIDVGGFFPFLFCRIWGLFNIDKYNSLLWVDPLFYRALLQKRLIILRSLLIVATRYLVQIRSYVIWYSMMDTVQRYSKRISWYSTIILKLYVSFAKEPYKRDDILQKRYNYYCREYCRDVSTVYTILLRQRYSKRIPWYSKINIRGFVCRI